jgi:hypothetical protein
MLFQIEYWKLYSVLRRSRRLGILVTLLYCLDSWRDAYSVAVIVVC